MIFISTGGFSDKTTYETCSELYKFGIEILISGEIAFKKLFKWV